MPVTFVAVNSTTGQTASTTTTAGTASITPTVPTGTAIGDRVFVFVAASNTSGTTPASWTAIFKDVQVGVTGTAPGSGTGRRYVSAYYRDRDTAWGMSPFTLTSATNNSHTVGVVTLRKDATETWNTPTVSGPGHYAPGTAGTAYSATSPSWAVATGAYTFGVTALNDNVSSGTPGGTTTGGIVLGTRTERIDGGIATGNIVRLVVADAPVTTGATGTITRTATLSGASQGGTNWLQQTVTVPPPTLPYSQDFTGTNGTLPANWSSAVASSAGTSSIQTNSLRVTQTVAWGGSIALFGPLPQDYDLTFTWTLNTTTDQYPTVNVRVPTTSSMLGFSSRMNDGYYFQTYPPDAATALEHGHMVAGVKQSGGPNAAGAMTAGTAYEVRIRIEGSRVRYRMWLATDPEPSTWLVDQGSLTATGTMLAIGTSGPTATTTMNVDDVAIVTPPQDVTRSLSDSAAITDSASWNLAAGGTPTRVQSAVSTNYQFAQVNTYTAPAWGTPTTAGNLLLFCASIDKAGGAANPGITAGWTIRAYQNGLSGGVEGSTILVATKTAVGNDTPPTITWTANSTTGGGANGILQEWSEVDTTTPLSPIVVAPYTGAQVQSITAGPLTPDTAAGRVLAFFTTDSMPTNQPASAFAPAATGWTANQLGAPAISGGAGTPGAALIERTAAPVAGTAVPATTFTWTNTADESQAVMFVLRGSGSAAGGADLTASLSDSAAITDSISTVLDAVRSLTDTVGTSESIATRLDAARSLTDSAAIVDTASTVLDAGRALSDAAAITDSATTSLAAVRQLTDSAAIVDTASTVLDAARQLTDAAGITDSATTQLAAARDLTDAAAIVDSATTVLDAQRGLADSAAIVDSATWVLTQSTERTLTDSAAITDSISARLDAVRELADAAGISESITTRLDAVRSLSDSAGITDSVTAVLDAARTLTDGAAIVDSATAVLDAVRTLTDSAAITDSASTVLDAQRALSDSAAITDSATTSLAGQRELTDSAAITDSVTWRLDVVRTLSDSAGITDSASTVMDARRELVDNAAIVDQASASLATEGGRQLSDSAAITDSATWRLDVVRELSDSAGITDEATAALSTPRQLTDSAAITDSATWRIDRHVTLVDSAAITDSVTAEITTGAEQNTRALSDSAAITDSATWRLDVVRQLVDNAAITDSATTDLRTGGATLVDNIAITDSISWRIDRHVTLVDNAAITDSATVARHIFVTLVDSAGIVDSATAVISTGRNIAVQWGAPQARQLTGDAAGRQTTVRTTGYRTLTGTRVFRVGQISRGDG